MRMCMFTFFFAFLPFDLLFLFFVEGIAMPFKRKRVFARRPSRLKRTKRIQTVKLVRPTRMKRTSRFTASRFRQGIVKAGKIVTMRYYFFAAPTAVLAVQNIQFRANSLFDPDFTGVGAQPRGFDQWVTLYDAFCVLSSTLTIQVRNPLDRKSSCVGIRVSEQSAETDTTIQDMVENKGGNTRFLHSMEQGAMTMKFSYNTKKFWGFRGSLNSLSDDAQDFQCTSAGNPAKQAYYTISTVRGGSSDNNPLNINGWIDYRVMCLEPKKFGGS